jgi:putative transposase
MARRPRQLIPGGVYHVMSRGNRRDPVFLIDNDRLLLLELVGQVAARRRWDVHAYCLMENHYHFVVSTPDADLSAGMRQINGEYARGSTAHMAS